MLTWRVCSVALLAVELILGQVVDQRAQFLIPDATPIKLRLARTLSSAIEDVGATVDFEVLEEVQLNGRVVIAKGAVAIGTVTESQKARRMGRAGKLNVVIDHVRTTANEKVALRAVRESEGGSNAGKMTGAIVATSIVFFPAAPLFLMIKGKDYKIPKGTEITAYVNGDSRLEIAKYFGDAVISGSGGLTASGSDSPVGRRPQPVTNEDILSLKRLGLGEDVILAKIAASECAFRLDLQDLAKLKEAGISDSVIKSMLERASR
jgi:hypothetical protein